VASHSGLVFWLTLCVFEGIVFYYFLGRIAALARCGLMLQMGSVVSLCNDRDACKMAEPIKMPKYYYFNTTNIFTLTFDKDDQDAVWDVDSAGSKKTIVC